MGWCGGAAWPEGRPGAGRVLWGGSSAGEVTKAVKADPPGGATSPMWRAETSLRHCFGSGLLCSGGRVPACMGVGMARGIAIGGSGRGSSTVWFSSSSSAKWQTAMKPQPETITSSRCDLRCSSFLGVGSMPCFTRTRVKILPSIEVIPSRAKIRAVVTQTPISPACAMWEPHSSGRKKPPPCVLGPSPSINGAPKPALTKTYVCGARQSGTAWLPCASQPNLRAPPVSSSCMISVPARR
mmetsp:Transcript_13442/g.43076  ORF Transcript_13442/g.43076 Transcript_13442/m.43076 type:complete len:240 (-) Transcript_13442:182-901(-)